MVLEEGTVVERYSVLRKLGEGAKAETGDER